MMWFVPFVAVLSIRATAAQSGGSHPFRGDSDETLQQPGHLPPRKLQANYCITGYIMDTFCIILQTLLDRPDLITLQSPDQHSIHCLIEVGSCVRSGYEVLGPPPYPGANYTRQVKLDANGNTLAYQLAQSTGICSICSGQGTIQRGFQATVSGVLRGSGNPPILDVDQVVPATVSCSSLLASNPTAPPVVPTTQPTLKPSSSPTAKPVTPTAKPVIPTAEPVIPTAKPVIPTAEPITPTTKPITPTNMPVTPTTKPITPTTMPVTPTTMPVTPTTMPVAPTTMPVAPTTMPVAPTTMPVTPTEMPVAPTTMPVAPTEMPVAPTTVPVAPTEMPVAPTTAPVTPTQAPVVVPSTAKPSGPPTVVITVPPGLCFSERSTVQELVKGVIPIKDVKIGDLVKDANGNMVRVYSFGHYQTDVKAQYLQLHAKGLINPIEMSRDHLVYVADAATPIPASLVLIGDKLRLVQGRVAEVTRIKAVERNGAYAPFTTSGTILVNGVSASNYVTLQTESPFLMLGPYSTSLSMHWLSHTFQSTHRLMCEWKLELCQRETYSKDGISTWVNLPFHATRWLLTHNAGVVIAILAPVCCFVILVYALESAYLYGFWLLMFAVPLVAFRHTRQSYSKSKLF